MWGNFSSSLGRATANFRWRSSGGIGEIGWAVIACLFISRFVSGYFSQAHFFWPFVFYLRVSAACFPIFFISRSNVSLILDDVVAMCQQSAIKGFVLLSRLGCLTLEHLYMKI